MITALELATARGLQNSIMLDTLTIERATGATETEFARETTWETIYAGKGRLQPDHNAPRLAELAGQIIRPGNYVGAIPWDAPTPNPGDRITITASNDPAMVDKRYAISSVEIGSTFVTARRFHAEEGAR